MNIENQIITYLKDRFEASPNDLGTVIPSSRQMLHSVLSKMLEKKMLEKIGRPPKGYYRIAEKSTEKREITEGINRQSKDFLAKHFNLFTETGNELNGLEAFEKWCSKQKLLLQKTIDEYIKTREKYLA
jgi:hypothetical protein